MKQNEGYQDFDKQVRQLLGQASEPVPEGAWEAIAARLAAGAGAGAAEAAAATEVKVGAAAAEAAAATGAGQSTVTPVVIGVLSSAGTRKAVILQWVRRTGFAVAGVAAAVLLAALLWNRPEQNTEDQLAVVTDQPQEPATVIVSEQGSEQTPVQNVELVQDEAPVQAAEPAVISEPHKKPMLAAAPKQSVVASSTIESAEQSAVTPEQSNAIEQTTDASQSDTPGQGDDTEQATDASQSVTTVTSEALAPVAVAAAQSTAVAQAESQPAETAVQPIDWDHLPDGEDGQAQSHQKVRPKGFHLAAYTNALSNFTSKKSGQYTGYSGVSGGGLPDHSYVKETGESNYSIPLTFGLNVTYDILPRFSMGIGLNYTRLSRHFSGTYYQLQADGTFDAGTDYDNVYNIQQFIGVPITAYFHIVRTKRINFYVYANGTVEKCLANTWTANNRTVNYNEPVKGVQFNAGAGLGVDFMLAPVVSIYLDPNVKYYFGLNQPKSIRTKQPFMFGFEAGLRFHL